MITKEGRDLPVVEITAENYVVPKGEEHIVHAKIEVIQFNPRTGARISSPRVQKFGMKEWSSSVMSSLRKQGYTIEILHDPYKFVKENAERLKKEAEEKAQAIKEAREKAKAEELAKLKEEAKAELLAELKAQGIIPDKTKKEK